MRLVADTEGQRAMHVTGTHHVALYTADLERLRRFYVETLGLPQVGAFPGGRIIFIDAGSTAIELISRAGWAGSATGSWQHLAFEVADVDATYEVLTAQGRKVSKSVSWPVFPGEHRMTHRCGRLQRGARLAPVDRPTHGAHRCLSSSSTSS